ncbi:hypothetical protein [Agrobacterium sp. YIC 4121]|uniref:hypothetical protein n=1 Tax=Agrobacterium sp. YIC 4121 TaxID=1923829 RepID=UPI00098EDDD8|nr:hypothetical protein [Agrobacterium sp. YIC 4121]OOO25578.1 hypothetical protein BTE54_23465 [Agrobacterium sp. YIC 4121]
MGQLKCGCQVRAEAKREAVTAELQKLVDDRLISQIFSTPLGRGFSRRVFASSDWPDYVLKMPLNSDGSNAREWNNWTICKDGSLSKWLAPCVAYCPDQDLLLMGKTKPIPRHFWPQFIPAFFGDDHKGNFGFFRGIFVCHDYSELDLTGFGWRQAPWRGRRDGLSKRWRVEMHQPKIEVYETYFDNYARAVRESGIA